ncbi:MAG TPA: AMP-binding protein, partial [Acidimicrobiales bacterium]|nr:AMP-binding protein [Acidimicrobiales bacterium]
MVPLVTRHTTHPHHVGVGGSQGETVLSALAANAGRDPGRPAMRHRQDGHWVVTTWGGYLARVREVATGLASLGVGARSRVAILSANRPEWHIADLAAMSVGAATVPLYPTSSVAQVAYALRHARVEVCVVDGHDAAGKVLEAAREASDVRYVVLIDGATRYTDSSLITFEELAATGAERLAGGDTTAEEAAATVRPDDLATIVYTSGTTGPPKGVMISHRNIMWTLRQVTPVYGVGEGDRLLSFLPLSHIAERMMSEFTPIGSGGETWFARSLATVAEDLPACRPDLFLAVPRVWEKLRDSVEAQVGGLPLPARVAVDGYIRLGLVRVAAAAAGRSPGPVPEAAWTALDRSVGVAIRRRIGLDRARVVVSAAAPIHPDLVRWFHAI